MKKKLLSILLCLCMVVTLLPTVALAASPAASVCVGGAQLSAGEYTPDGSEITTTKPGDNYAYFEVANGTATLTLHNFTYSGAGADIGSYGNSAVCADGALAIVLEGENSVTQSKNNSGSSYGIYCKGDLTISGAGTLNATGGAAASGDSKGIHSSGKLTVSGGTITATGGAATSSYGVYASGGAEITGGVIKAYGKEAGSGKSNENSCGIFFYGESEITGGAVTAVGAAGYSSYGILAYGSITISGGTVNATGGTANSAGYSCGIYTDSTLKIENYTTVVTAVSAASGCESYGIYSNGSASYNPQITSGVVTASGTKQAMNLCPKKASSANLSHTDAIIYAGKDEASAKRINISMTPKYYTSPYAKISAIEFIQISSYNPYVSGKAGEIPADAGFSLTAAATDLADGCTRTITYQWYSNTTNSKTGGTEISGETSANYHIPTDLTAGDHYYYCILKADGCDDLTSPVFTAYISAADTYTLTVNLDGGSGADSGGDYASGAVIKIDAGTKSGYTFSGWTSLNGGSFGDASSAATTFTMPAKATTITASWSYNGGSTGGGSYTPTYSITNGTTSTANGSVTLDKTNATSGSTVKITPKAKDGYEVDTITVKDANGKAIAVTKNADGTFSFKMPSGKVTVESTFKEIVTEAPWVNPFGDVSESDWFYSAVKYANENGLFAGTGADTFSPSAPMTREMLWTVLGRLDGQTMTGSDVFDAAKDWATEKGITDGSNPNGEITREQLVTILWRYAGSPAPTGNLDGFSDADSVADYAKLAMAWAVENGIVSGSNGALMPTNPATRGQVAAIVMRYAQSAEK